jgi:hypothetical protein
LNSDILYEYDFGATTDDWLIEKGIKVARYESDRYTYPEEDYEEQDERDYFAFPFSDYTGKKWKKKK